MSRGDDCLDAGQRQRFADVDAADVGVGVRAAQDAAVQEARQLQVGAVEGTAGHLIDAVVANGARADHLVFVGRAHGACRSWSGEGLPPCLLWKKA